MSESKNKMKIIFWSEFPEKVDWKSVRKLFLGARLKAEIYIACRSRKEFYLWKRKIECGEITVGAWPILSMEEGYWFSGFSEKSSIDKLKEFSGLKVKVDLEHPFPSYVYSNLNLLIYYLRLIFLQGRNSEYLKKTIDELSKDTEVIVNEFPFSRSLLKNAGIHYNTAHRPKTYKNIMLYSTITGETLKPLSKAYLRNFAKNAIKLGNKDRISFSLGLIGTGILKREGTYQKIGELKEDIDFVKSLGMKRVAIYSIDSIMGKGREAGEWINLIAGYQR